MSLKLENLPAVSVKWPESTPEVESTARAKGNRIQTGISEFDNLIEGGIPRGSLILLVGNPGAGKTIFASQFIHDGLKIGEAGIYVSFAEDRATFLVNMKKLGMDFEKYEKNGLFKYMELITVEEKGINQILETVFAALGSSKAKRLVIDSITALNQAFSKTIDARIVLHTILGKMCRTMRVTTLLIAEQSASSELGRGGMEEFVADGVVVLTQSTESGYADRRINIAKMRGTNVKSGRHRFIIDRNGLVVYPHPTIEFFEKASTEKVETGIEALDGMLEGGFFKGSLTRVGGASGTGKTTLSLHFAMQGAKRNEATLYVSFEEPVEQLVRHGEGFGWNIRELMNSGLMKIVSYCPEPYNVDELLLLVRDLIKEQKPARFVLDGTESLQRILPENEYVRYLQSLRSYLKPTEITTVFTCLEGTSAEANSPVSTLMDNIISLRNVEIKSELRRSLVIFKARGTAHERDIREFNITRKGMIIKDKFVGLEQVLGGSPRRSFTEETAESWAKAFGGKT